MFRIRSLPKWLLLIVFSLIIGCSQNASDPLDNSTGSSSAPSESTSSTPKQPATNNQPSESATSDSEAPAEPESDEVNIILSTTTSFFNTGLAEVLAEQFEKETGIHVRVLAKGTGAALREGQEGRADVLVVHAPPAEQKLIDGGFAIERTTFMHNTFVVVGPEDDPAEIAQSDDVLDAFRKIAESESGFVSRGDDSGTHKKERSIWEATRTDPAGDWYQETGQGMGASLQVADQTNSYCLSDIGTYLAYLAEDRIQLKNHCDRGGALYNPYSVMLVNPEKFDAGRIHVGEARQFAEYLTRSDIQKQIGEFKRELFGQSLFTPDLLSNGQSTGSE